MPDTFDSQYLELAFTNLSGDIKAGRANAAVLGIATSNEVVRLEAFRRTNEKPVTPEHIFLLASITKPIVATAVMQLVAEGHLLLNEPLGHHLPELAGMGKPDLSRLRSHRQAWEPYSLSR